MVRSTSIMKSPASSAGKKYFLFAVSYTHLPWLLQGDGKMSKSKGNVLYADELVDFFGVDAVRYFVLHEMPFENDGIISWELMVERLNSDLANTLGNLVNRTVSMTNKYFGGTVCDKGAAEDVDADLKAVMEGTPKAVESKMEGLRVADAITEIFNLFKRCNKYIDETMPWVPVSYTHLLGEKGAYYYMDGRSGLIESYPIEAVDTTGAGDCFFAGLLYQIKIKGGIDKIVPDDFPQILSFANAAGALAATKRGGTKGSPSLQEVTSFLAKQK